jgi:hypothetical protein
MKKKKTITSKPAAKKPAAKKTATAKTKRTTTTPVARRKRAGERAKAYLEKHNLKSPPKTLLIIWILVFVELFFDFVTTIISFAALSTESDCCGDPINIGKGLTLGLTIPFLFLILAEVCMLGWSIKQFLLGQLKVPEGEDTSCLSFLGSTLFQKVINIMLMCNPFFGFMVAWMLLYQSNKNDSLTVLGLEAASLVLHFVSVWLEGQIQTRLSMAFHAIPIIPFLAGLIVILVYLDIGGVCFLVEEKMFWYKGCNVCADGTLPMNDLCPDGTGGERVEDEFCSPDKNFCFFAY